MAALAYFGFIRNKRKLQKAHDHLNFALKSGNMGTWEFDLRTQKQFCSPEMLAIWGVKPEEFDNSRHMLQNKVHPEDVMRMRALINFAIENDTVYELKYRIYPSPGIERWVLSRGRCLFDGPNKTPTVFAGVAYDITEAQHREEELEQAIKAREQFLSIAGHELKTPLSCMLLQLEVNEWDLKHLGPSEFTAEKLQLSMKKYRQNLNRITRIVDNILDETTISQGKLQLRFEHSDLDLMIKNLINQIQLMADQSGIELHFRSKGSIFGLWDTFKIEQVLLNLMINAIRYGKKKPIYIEIDEDEDHALITVKDQGIGIKPEDCEKIFQRFERVSEDPTINGIGLGLYISHSIVKSHRGEIKLTSELGKGSEFKVMLPKNLETQTKYECNV